MNTSLSRARFGTAPDGSPVDIFTMRNRNGVEARITNYGGILVSFTGPDRNGTMADVVVGYDNLEGFLAATPYFGAVIGRYGNRIANAKFTLEGKTYALAANNGPNALHGGLKGFDKVVWNVGKAEASPDPRVELSYLSKDDEEGYPGNLDVKAVYSLTDDNGLRLDFTATTDKATVVNLTQHTYFNLAGRGDVLGHEVFIDADRFTPVNSALIPTGELRSVAGTPLDFRKPAPIGARIEQDDEQLKFGNGYDHNYVLNHPAGRLDVIARVTEPETGRILEVLTTEPGVQLYTGNFLNGSITGKDGRVYHKRTAFCLEAQHYPDSPNQPNFPTTILQPGQTYRNTIVFRLSREDAQHG